MLRLGEMISTHAQPVMHSLLVGCCDHDAAVRASCLACLAQVCANLRYGVHPWSVELLQCIHTSLEGEKDAQTQQAACHLLSSILDCLGDDALSVLSSRQLRAILVQLRFLRDGKATDELLQRHVAAALDQLHALGASFVKAPALPVRTPYIQILN